MLDYIIVGQGLAGTLFAHLALKNNQKILVIDQDHKKASSAIAAGIINPITGRRYVKSWMIDELIPVAERVYTELEEVLGEQFYVKRNVIRALFSVREENEWLERAARPDYAPYIVEKEDWSEYKSVIHSPFSIAELKSAVQVRVPQLIVAYREHLKAQNAYENAVFDYESVEIESNHVNYKGLKARNILFAEGYQAENNPYFNYLPFQAAKGEVLIIRIPNYKFEKMLKYHIFLIHLEEDIYWVGATNEHNYTNEEKSKKGKKYLLDKLNMALKIPFEVLDHKVAIRPTVRDRRPFLGRHPEFKPLCILNGLGTKGASLGPYWTAALWEHLENNKALHKEVNIQRFMS